jgi:hypothetical protein
MSLKRLLITTALIAALGLAACQPVRPAARVYVSLQAQHSAGPDFFRRVQSVTLGEALSKPGTVVDVAPGLHTLKIPCDGVADGQFASVGVNLQEGMTNRLVLFPCGALVSNDAHRL